MPARSAAASSACPGRPRSPEGGTGSVELNFRSVVVAIAPDGTALAHTARDQRRMAMGLFDKMFGRGASDAASQPQAHDRFNQLKQKYMPVLHVIEQDHVQLRNLHVQEQKLVIRGEAPSQEAKNRVWDEIKRVDPQYTDLMADIEVREQSRAAQPSPAQMTPGVAGMPGPASMTGAAGRAGADPFESARAHQGAEVYIVKSGDTLSKIARQFYGDGDEYMRIFYANRDRLSDPDKIQVGQQLVIPPDTD
jgi:LysM domain